MRLVKPSSFSFVAMLLLVGSNVFQVGCQSTATTYDSYGSTGWDSSDEPSVAGITHAKLSWYRRGDSLIFVVWTDLRRGLNVEGGGTTTASGADQFDEEFVDNVTGEQLFAYHYKGNINDDISVSPGTITIDKTIYDLRDGLLLLVSTRGGQTQVKQLDLKVSSIQLLQDGSPKQDIRAHFQSMANENTDIRSFFDSAGGQR